MNFDDFLSKPALVFFLLVLLVVGGSLIFGDFRNRFARALHQLGIWAVIIAAVAIIFSMRDDIEGRLFPSATVDLEGSDIVLTRARDGHFYATLSVNGADIRFIVDTGASQIVISQADALRAGIDPNTLNYAGRAQTANGVVRTARVRLDKVEFGDRVDSNLVASVNDGEMETSLLGMTYLSRFSKIEIAGRTLRLVP